ncbi:hypothetical protein Y032_0073g780 [Ancylostoma ceylanicum]|uniref:Uncharacterized protein n=1 Tax=Ancylostoma ceylanicum TaxID=53326 RepID=A0A016TWB6_9BILA|nr:hypothetical protein Y032_0073g780 [Ancylostoma ceylanicum]
MATMTTPDSDNAESFSSAPLSFRAPVSNCAKSIIDRKLRKFASETSFATETASESSVEREFTGRTRVFTVKAVPRRMHHNAHQRARHDSDGSGGSEATVASGSATPRRAFRRPKSQGELHTSCTSATIHSLESAANVMVNDDRRPSHAYMIDDDSIHEFEDDDGEEFYSCGGHPEKIGKTSRFLLLELGCQEGAADPYGRIKIHKIRGRIIK